MRFVSRQSLIDYWPAFAFLLIAIVFYYANYQPGMMVLRGDTGYPLNPELFLERHLSAWWSAYMNGQPAGHAYSFAFPLAVIILFLTHLFGAEAGQFVLMASMYTGAGVFVYAFLMKINSANKSSAFIGAMLYMCNPFIIAEWAVPNLWFFTLYMAFPAFALCAYIVNKQPLRGLATISIVSILFASGYANTPLFFALMGTTVLMQVFCVLRTDGTMMRAILLSVATVATILIANFWWLGLAFLFKEEGATLLKGTMDVGLWLSEASRRADVVNLLFLTFSPNIAGGSTDYTKLITSPLVLWSMSIIPLSIFGILMNRSRNRQTILLFVMFVFIGFLTKGSQPPFGDLYHWAMNNIPLFVVMKTPSEKFGVAFLLICALLIGSQRLPRWYAIGFSIFLIAISYPVWSGKLIADIHINHQTVLKGYQQVPDNYLQAADYINGDGTEGRTLLLPATTNYMSSYKSNQFRGLDWMRSLVKTPVIEGFDTGKDNLGAIYENLGDPLRLEYVLGLYNVRWIVINRDVDIQAYGFNHRQTTDQILEAFKGYEFLEKKSNFGPLQLYVFKGAESQVHPDRHVSLPPVYLANKIALYKDLGPSPSLFNHDYYQTPLEQVYWTGHEPTDVFIAGPSANALSARQLMSLNEGKTQARGGTTVHYRRLSPSRMEIRVENLEQTKAIIFSEAFHRHWKVYPMPWQKVGTPSGTQNLRYGSAPILLSEAKPTFHAEWGREPLDESSHFTANGYANGWILNPELIRRNWPDSLSNDNSIRFIAEFQQRRILIAASLISGIYIVLCLLYLSFCMWQSAWQKNRKVPASS